jgi:preprotein translocase subunit SecA
VSLEDKLMRLFGSDRIAGIMDKLGHKEGDVLQHNMITKSIERAQKKVEENNFGMRKRLLEYDDVMNIQRNAIYTRRNNALEGERLGVDLDEMFYQLCEDLAHTHKTGRKYAAFVEDCIRYFGTETQIAESDFNQKDANQVTALLYREISQVYQAKYDNLATFFLPLIEQILSDPNNHYERIALPFTDGVRGLQLSTDLRQALETKGKSIVHEIERSVTLALIDLAWKEHLRNMDELREQVQNASFEQKDPLVIYKKESYGLFEKLMGRINRDTCSFLFRGTIPVQPAQDGTMEVEGYDEEAEAQARAEQEYQEQLEAQRREEARRLQEQQRAQAQQQAQQQARNQPLIRTQQPNRNDPCPCGSGKKFKNCHGKD